MQKLNNIHKSSLVQCKQVQYQKKARISIFVSIHIWPFSQQTCQGIPYHFFLFFLLIKTGLHPCYKINQVKSQSPTERASIAKCNKFPTKKGYLNIWFKKWKIDYDESSILKKYLLRGKEIAVWHTVQLNPTSFMKGFEHTLYVHISV